MKTYTIDIENSITAHASKQEAGEGESFGSQQELASLVAEWPTDRLVEVWNGIPGLTFVKKFTDVGGQVDLESDPEPGRWRRGGNRHDGPEAAEQG